MHATEQRQAVDLGQDGSIADAHATARRVRAGAQSGDSGEETDKQVKKS